MNAGPGDPNYPFGGGGDLELGLEPGDPLLPWASGSRSSRRKQGIIELDDIPPIIKSANGNIFWADEQCTRRVGLTSTEARLFLRLLQVDEPEDYNYGDYKAMFENFGKEQARLQELVQHLPWWKPGARQQKKIWEARVEWLARMKEPRPWLLFLMARRKRIIKQATERVLQGLRKKSEARTVTEIQAHSPEPGNAAIDGDTVSPGQNIFSDISTPSDTVLNAEPLKMEQIALSLLPNDTSQTPDAQVTTASKILSAASRLQHGLRVGLKGEHKEERHSPSSPVNANDLSKPWDATRQDIKRQVERLLPDPTPYIVIGWFRRSASDPKERILRFDKTEHFFHVLRSGERAVRGWRGYFSLKSLQGFGLYKCDITRGAHLPLSLNASQQATFSQFYLAYRASECHPDDTVSIAWANWVHKNLNDGKIHPGKNNPLEGEYSLQLMYDWSSYRLVAIIAIPLLLSLAIGGWYMNGHGDVVTAWTLALYIVTAAAAGIGLLAIIGTLNDI